MTREEAKHIVDVAFTVPLAVRRFGEDRTYQEDEIREAKNMAIKALEQENVLDKIRAEIEQLRANLMTSGGVYEHSAYGLDYAMQIIDKYKESEDNE